jgi:hypothetical protein
LSPRLRAWLFWRRVRLLIVGLFDRGGDRAARRPTDAADPLGMLGDDLARAAEQMDADAALGLPQPDAGYEPVELTPALRARRDGALAELIEAQGRRQERRVRVRRARVRARVVAAGMAVGLIVVMTAGATAIGVDVPLFDRAVEGIRDVQSDSNGTPTTADDEVIHLPGPYSDIRPGPGDRSEALEVPLSANYQGKSAELVSYMAPDDLICNSIVHPPAAEGREETASWGCLPQEHLRDTLSRERVTIGGYEFYDTTTIHGYVREDVEAVEIRGPTGAMEAALGQPWEIDGSDGRITVRPFAATAIADFSSDVPAERQERRSVDGKSYVFTLTLEDGRTLDVRPSR